MEKAILIALIMALIAVVGVLLLGVVSFARGGAFAKRYGNQLMRARIVAQALAVLLFIAAYIFWNR